MTIEKKVKPSLPHTVWVSIDTLDADRATFSGYNGPQLRISRNLWTDLGEPHLLNVTLAAVQESP